MKKIFYIIIVILLFPIVALTQGLLNKGVSIQLNSGTFLTIKNAGFDNNTANTVVDNLGTISMEGVLHNLGEITGTVILDGASNTNAVAGGLEILEVNTSGTVSLTGGGSVSKLLKINTGATLNTNGQTFIIKSDSQRTALVHHNGGTTTGDFIVERYVSDGNGHHFVSSPVSDATVSELGDDFSLNLSSSFPNIYFYEETSTATTGALRWASPSTTAHNMSAAEGYTCYFNANNGATIDISGDLNNGDILVDLTFTNSNPVSSNTSAPDSPEGWNFIGNPYASPLDYDLLIGALANSSSIEQALYVWDPITDSYANYINGISSPATFSPIIPTMQGFWMRTSATETLTITNSMRITDPDITPGTFKNSSNYDPLVRLELDGQGNNMETVLTFNSAATNNFEAAYDAYYLPGGGPNEVQFASTCNVGNLSINSLAPIVNPTTIIPLHSQVTTAGSYTISIKELSNFYNGHAILLEDLSLSVLHDLKTGDYTYTASPNDANNRFRINIQPTITGTNSIANNKLNVFKSGNNTLVVNLPAKSLNDQWLRIHDVLGRELYSRQLIAGQTKHLLNDLRLQEHAVYIITVNNIDQGVKIKW